MLTKEVYQRCSKKAAEYLKKAGIAITEKEREAIQEVKTTRTKR
jgi:hypothetical protein